MRNIGSIVQNITTTTLQAASAKHLEKAHRAAAEFHEAMADVFDAQDDIERYEQYEREAKANNVDTGFWADERAESQKAFKVAFGRASAALLEMPIRWQAILQTEIDNIKEPT